MISSDKWWDCPPENTDMALKWKSLEGETESFTIAEQKNGIRTNYVKAKINSTLKKTKGT